MYTLLHNIGLRRGLLAEAPSLVLSLFVAEMFYKFHSFTLESVSFLATWYAVGYLFSLVRSSRSAKQDTHA
jgi:hypothetical protein